jgi:TolB-like protein
VGTGEALASDLPQIGFRVVERTQLAAVLAERPIGQVIDPEQAKDAGKLAGADFVVLGSVLHQRPRVRADVRFTDVRTGIAINTASAEAPDDDFPRLLRELAQEIAKRFNEKLTEEQLAQLAGHRMSREDFERWARAQLAKETLARREAARAAAKAPKPYKGPSRTPAWIAGSGVAVGLVTAGVATAMALQSAQNLGYADGLLSQATRQEDIDRITSERNQQRTSMYTWTGVAIGGAVIAGGSAAYLLWRNVRAPPPEEEPAVVLVPAVAPVPGGGVLAVSGRF